MSARGFVCIRVLMRFESRFLFSSLTVVPGGCGVFFPLAWKGVRIGHQGTTAKGEYPLPLVAGRNKFSYMKCHPSTKDCDSTS